MNSLPQELIDTIIDGLPRPSLLSSSLVAKRWRRRSQQRALERIKFLSEAQVNRWCTDFPQDPEGIISYVQVARFEGIFFWSDPATFCRALKSLGSLTELWVSRTEIPDELPGQISRGELGKGITVLRLLSTSCTLATVVSVILSLPSLEVLRIVHPRVKSRGLLQSHPVTSQRTPLDLLELRGYVGGIEKALADSGFTFRRLFLDVDLSGVEQLIMLSSETVMELALYDGLAQENPHHTISLPALTTLDINLRRGGPLPRLIAILSSISSAPALGSVTIGHNRWSKIDQPFRGAWADIDRWLAQVARQARVRGGLSVMLKWWPKGKPVWEGFLCDFRRAGGQVKTDAHS